MPYPMRPSFLLLGVAVAAGCTSRSTTETEHHWTRDASPTEPAASSRPRDAGAGTGTPDDVDGTDPAGGDAGPLCEDLDTASLSYVTVANEAGPPPQLNGGTIVAGTYVLTGASSHVVIGSPPSPPSTSQLRGTLKIDATKLIIAVEPTPGTVHTSTLDYSAANAALSFVTVCFVHENGAYEIAGANEGGTVDYEATATAITLRLLDSVTFETDENGNTVVTAKSEQDLVFTR